MDPASEAWFRHALTRLDAQLVIDHAPRVRTLRGARSYLDDGRGICWSPTDLPAGARIAADAERLGQAVPAAVGARLGDAVDLEDPLAVWTSWTRTEVLAKLHHVPILVWLTTRGPAPVGPMTTGSFGEVGRADHALLATTVTEGVVVSLGLHLPEPDVR